MSNLDRSLAAEFDDADVVASYVHRPAYPEALISRLLNLMPARGRVLDVGCGPGKLSRALAPHVDEVVGVDPSAAMLALADKLDAGAHQNLRWVQGRAEDLQLDVPVHLVVAGASIHWIDAAVLFPRLARWLAPGAVIAIVDGDEPASAPWIETYRATIRGWVERLGGRWNDDAHRARSTAHEPWLDIQGRDVVVHEVSQSIDDLIEAEHSRATWARRRMGALAEAFDADLRATLAPWAKGGLVTYGVKTRLMWGAPKAHGQAGGVAPE